MNELIKERNEIAKQLLLNGGDVRECVNIANRLMRDMHGSDWNKDSDHEAEPTPEAANAHGYAITIAERNGEKWVRVQALGEDFLIAAYNYRKGDKDTFTWEESCKIGTFSKKQVLIICAFEELINAELRKIGGEELKELYWTSSEYNRTTAWVAYFSTGNVPYNKCNSYRVRPCAAF